MISNFQLSPPETAKNGIIELMIKNCCFRGTEYRKVYHNGRNALYCGFGIETADIFIMGNFIMRNFRTGFSCVFMGLIYTLTMDCPICGGRITSNKPKDIRRHNGTAKHKAALLTGCPKQFNITDNKWALCIQFRDRTGKMIKISKRYIRCGFDEAMKYMEDRQKELQTQYTQDMSSWCERTPMRFIWLYIWN